MIEKTTEKFSNKIARNKAAGRWETEQGGEYFTAGVGGAITGRGADLLIIDDPLGTRCIVSYSHESAYEWYIRSTSAFTTGRQDGVVMTRWTKVAGDVGQEAIKPKADQWHVVEFRCGTWIKDAKPVWLGIGS